MEIDLLMTRIVDGEGGDAAWRRFADLAATDPSAWRSLAESQRLHSRLSLAVADALAHTDDVPLPSAPAADAASVSLARLSRWSGWAVAAAVAITWVGGLFTGDARVAPADSSGQAGLVNWAPQSSQEAINAYLEVGQKTGNVLGEVPRRVMVESRPMSGGKGFEVVFIRQFVERAVVTDLYNLGSDEVGAKVLVPVSKVRPGGDL